MRVIRRETRGEIRRVNHGMSLEVTGRVTRGMTCRMPVPVPGWSLSGVLCCVPAQIPDEVVTTATLAAVMLAAMS